MVYTSPPPVPPFVVALNVNFALLIVISVSALVKEVAVEEVNVPSLAYTRHEYHLCPTYSVALIVNAALVVGVVHVLLPGVPPLLVAYPKE